MTNKTIKNRINTLLFGFSVLFIILLTTCIIYSHYKTKAAESKNTLITCQCAYLDIPLSNELQTYTYRKAKEYNLDYSLLLALMDQNSNFMFNKVNGENYGLFQINSVNLPSLNKLLGTTDLINPYQNIEAACYILSDLSKKHTGYKQILMAYFLGEETASQYLQQGIYTNDYIDEIMLKRSKYYEYLHLSDKT